MTVDQCLRVAFGALLRGDTETRDRYCRLAQNIMAAKDRLDKGYPVEEAIQPGLPICQPDRSKQ